jgi:hypothetical protein
MRVQVSRVNARVTAAEGETLLGAERFDRLVDAVAERVQQILMQSERADRDRVLHPDIFGGNARW